jgi:hypothetical protein
MNRSRTARATAARCVPILLAIAGCGTADARVQVSYVMRPGLPASAFRTTIDDGSGARELRGAELAANASQVSTPVLDTRRRGTLRVGFALEADGASASRGEVAIPLRSDWIWSVSVQIDTIDPRRMCFGCAGSRAFPLAERYRRTPADSVWVTWGGNGIKHPVIY